MRFAKSVQTAALLGAACAASACASAAIGDAQTAFNEAARIEASAGADSDEFALPAPSTAVPKYAEALRLLDAEISSNAADLAADKLLGVAYTLKAMSQWRIADLTDDLAKAEEAGKAVDAATAENDGRSAVADLGPRDRVILLSVKGLTDVVRGRLAADYDDPQKGARACFMGGLAGLKSSVEDPKLDKLHPIRIWVGLSALRACQQWAAVVQQTFGKPGMDQNTARQKLEECVVKWSEHAKSLKPFLSHREHLRDTIRRSGFDMGLTDQELDPLLGVAANPPDDRTADRGPPDLAAPPLEAAAR